MSRKYLTNKEKGALLERQRWRCAICGRSMSLSDDIIEYDHAVPVALGNEEKPDQALCHDCHKAKSVKDVKAIAKTKRIQRKAAGLTKPKRAIQSRGFDKRYRKRMDGTVEKRT